MGLRLAILGYVLLLAVLQVALVVTMFAALFRDDYLTAVLAWVLILPLSFCSRLVTWEG